jgi:hypothetical protein
MGAKCRNRTTSDELTEVFRLMRALNKEALQSREIGAASHDGQTFKRALEQAIHNLAESLVNKQVTYIELGPEPIKTEFILQTLQDLSVNVIRYVGVDINPSSEATMRQMVENILPQEHIEYCISSFDDLQLERDQSDDSIAVATMLGFQEGNEAPTVMRSWLEAILKPGDILSSGDHARWSGHYDYGSRRGVFRRRA